MGREGVSVGREGVSGEGGCECGSTLDNVRW